MRFAIAWDFPALVALYKLPPHGAMIVDRAVLGFADTGAGHLEWVAPYYRLRAGVHDVVLAIDTATERVTVLRIYRAR